MARNSVKAHLTHEITVANSGSRWSTFARTGGSAACQAAPSTFQLGIDITAKHMASSVSSRAQGWVKKGRTLSLGTMAPSSPVSKRSDSVSDCDVSPPLRNAAPRSSRSRAIFEYSSARRAGTEPEPPGAKPRERGKIFTTILLEEIENRWMEGSGGSVTRGDGRVGAHALPAEEDDEEEGGGREEPDGGARRSGTGRAAARGPRGHGHQSLVG